MKKKALVSILVTGLAATTIMSGCSSSSSSTSESTSGTAASTTASSTTAADEIKSTELNILYSGTPEVHEKEYLMDEYFKNFEEMYNVKVNVDFLTQADAITKIQTEQETGKIVNDILYVDTANMAPYVNGDWMEDISDVVGATGSTYTNMFDGTTNKDGKRCFVPNSFDIYVLIANVKALDYLPDGLTREDVEKGLTWEQYADWAVAIAKGEGVGKTMMPANMTGSQLLYPMGGMSLAFGGGFPEFTSDGFSDALGIIASIAEGDGFYPEQDQYTAVTDPMNNGDVWLAFSHMAPASASYNAAPNNFVIGAAPSGSEGVGSTSGAWCYGIQKGAAHEDLAEAFIKYIAQPDVNYEFCSNFGSLSPIEQVSNIVSDEDAVMKAGLQVLTTAKVTGVPSTNYTDWNAVKLLYGDIFNEILSTKKVPDESFLKAKQDELEALEVTK